jgi:hypothetical protein
MPGRARIYRKPKTAMQSGVAGTHVWILEFEATERRRADPLMGWSGGADTQTQVRLKFDTREEAIAYADREGLTYDVELPHDRTFRPKVYADNFKFGRTDNWTH